jgi:hypothetical protein
MKVSLSPNFKYLLFVGSGRTGSTLVGQILNCHPNILITNESRILQHCINTDTQLISHVPKLIDIAHHEFLNGTHQYDKPEKQQHKNKWQRDWKNTAQLSLPEKSTIRFIGDKKQGGNTKLITHSEDKVRNALSKINFVPITVMRNPEQVFKSYLRLNNDLTVSRKTVFNDMLTGYSFCKENNGIIIRYETLLNDPAGWCKKISKSLELEYNEGWKEVVCNTVNSSKKELVLNDEEIEYFRSHSDYHKLNKAINDTDI